MGDLMGLISSDPVNLKFTGSLSFYGADCAKEENHKFGQLSAPNKQATYEFVCKMHTKKSANDDKLRSGV